MCADAHQEVRHHGSAKSRLDASDAAARYAPPILLERKDDMRRRGLASPDDGDALALTFAYPVARKDWAEERRFEEGLQRLKGGFGESACGRGCTDVMGTHHSRAACPNRRGALRGRNASIPDHYPKPSLPSGVHTTGGLPQ